MALFAGAGAGAARAAGWTAEQVASRAGSSGAALAGVSCLAVGCTAVGWSVDPLNGDQTLVERREGGAWAIQNTPNPQGMSGSGGDVTAVSCPRPAACEAVGNTTAAIGNQVFIMGWNGTRWGRQSVPLPADDTHNLDNPPADFLQGVSCPRVNLCIAVGSYQSRTGVTWPLSERWNGRRWQVLPRAQRGASLAAVSCARPDACMAVGGAIAERWNGRGWTLEATARPTGSRARTLDGVSCVSASRCVAVGSYGVGTQATLAELWNGRRWALLGTPAHPGGSPSAHLAGVSCPAANVCTAVGASRGPATGHSELAERWNGSSWTVQATPSTGGSSTLNGVSCSAPSACTAVGVGAGRLPLALAYS